MKANYQKIASALSAIKNCESFKDGKDYSSVINRHQDTIDTIMNMAPSGSGIDSGIHLDGKSDSKRLVFTFGFHYMNQDGYYDGWTEHKAIITPSLQFGYNMRITGKDHNMIKDYLYDTITQWLDDTNE